MGAGPSLSLMVFCTGDVSHGQGDCSGSNSDLKHDVDDDAEAPAADFKAWRAMPSLRRHQLPAGRYGVRCRR